MAGSCDGIRRAMALCALVVQTGSGRLHRELVLLHPALGNLLGFLHTIWQPHV
jgi:hypothetical protein